MEMQNTPYAVQSHRIHHWQCLNFSESTAVPYTPPKRSVAFCQHFFCAAVRRKVQLPTFDNKDKFHRRDFIAAVSGDRSSLDITFEF